MAVAVRGRVAWFAPLLLFLAVLLLGSLAFAIANLDRGEEVLPQFPDIGATRGASPFGPSGDQLRILLQITVGSIAVFAIAGILFARWKGEKVISRWELLGYVVAMGFLVGMIALFPEITAVVNSLTQTGGGTSPPGSSDAGGMGGLPTSTAFPLLLAILLVVMAGIWLFVFGSKVFPAIAGIGKGRPPERERRRLEAASAVRRTLLDLEAGGDFRTAVLACYQRMCTLFATKGVARQEALTPREIEVLALAELGLSQGVVDDLTGLFEEARYSEHEIGPAQRDRAVECLTSIRRELEA